MRVIVGEYRGRKLTAPPGDATRPILDRVKQALFDRLGSRWGLPGELPEFHVLDLYAGAGNLGIECLSRGARSACFVESDGAALRCLRANIEALGLASRARVINGRAERATIPVPADGFGLIFLDPPYPDSLQFAAASPLGRAWARLGGELPVRPDALAVWRFPDAFNPPAALPGGWSIEARHDYGTMSLAFCARATT